MHNLEIYSLSYWERAERFLERQRLQWGWVSLPPYPFLSSPLPPSLLRHSFLLPLSPPSAPISLFPLLLSRLFSFPHGWEVIEEDLLLSPSFLDHGDQIWVLPWAPIHLGDGFSSPPTVTVEACAVDRAPIFQSRSSLLQWEQAYHLFGFRHHCCNLFVVFFFPFLYFVFFSCCIFCLFL